ncbi:ABC transporter permease [Martelella sp. AMO21009]
MIEVFRQLWAHPVGRLGLIACGFNLFLFVFGPALMPYDPDAFSYMTRLAPPSAAHWFGTDEFGRDTLSRILAGARTTIGFGVLATLIGTLAGAIIGITSGYLGGLFDEIVMRFVDAFIAIPNLLLSMLIVIAIGATTGNAILAIAVAFTPSIARVARSTTLSIKQSDYIKAAQSRADTTRYIVLRELAPNVIAPVIVEGTIRISFAIMLGATLSYLGLGAQPPASDWGLLVSEARQYLLRSPWLVIWPGLGIAVVSIGFNLLGDGLRDVLNPRSRH